MNLPIYNISGIKCDVCDYNEPSVKAEDYGQWLNRPCPKCGANLLTQADYDTVNDLLLQSRLTGLIIKAAPAGAVVLNDGPFPVRGRFNGSGEVIWEENNEGGTENE